MKPIIEYDKQQEAIRLHTKIDSFFDNFTIGTLLNRAGIRKMRGVSPIMLLKAVFVLPFEGNNFFRGIVTGKQQEFRKDAAYDLLNLNSRFIVTRQEVVPRTSDKVPPAVLLSRRPAVADPVRQSIR
jgi:hypothetical protein